MATKAVRDGRDVLLLPAAIDETPDEANEDDTVTEERVKAEIETATSRLFNLTFKLGTATKPAEIDRLNLEIQRLRVQLMLLEEIDTKKSNSDLHREMKLLRQMAADGAEANPEPEQNADTERAQSAAETLDKAGIDPTRAGNLLRLLNGLMSNPNGHAQLTAGSDPPGPGDPPAGPRS